MATKAKLLLIVGDPDQSIYSFKYAHPSGISEFSAKTDVTHFSSVVTWRCPKAVIRVANALLSQADPTRADLLAPAPGAIDGETHFIQKQNQTEEFAHILKMAGERLVTDGAQQILILAPRRKLGDDFAKFAEANKSSVGIPADIHFRLTAKHNFTEQEQGAILYFSLLAKPVSILHRRSYLGIGDDQHFAKEFKILQEKYGSLGCLQALPQRTFPLSSGGFVGSATTSSPCVPCWIAKRQSMWMGLLISVFPSPDTIWPR